MYKYTEKICIEISRSMNLIMMQRDLCVSYLIFSNFVWTILATNSELNYPLACRNESIIEDHFGKKIADPYRWLEDPDSEQTQKYVEEVNKISQPFLENSTQYNKIKERLTALHNYPKCGLPERHGNYYFTFSNTGLQNQ